MHRSGTSALARGLQMLGVYLGNDFISPKPDNPTGYWEDRNIYEINERLLAVLGLKWEDIELIDDARWHEPEVEALLAEADRRMYAVKQTHHAQAAATPQNTLAQSAAVK